MKYFKGVFKNIVTFWIPSNSNNKSKYDLIIQIEYIYSYNICVEKKPNLKNLHIFSLVAVYCHCCPLRSTGDRNLFPSTQDPEEHAMFQPKSHSVEH